MVRYFVLLTVWFQLSGSVTAAADDPIGPLSPWQLRAALARRPTGGDLERLVAQAYATFKKEDLQAGAAKPKIEDTLACFAFAAPMTEKTPQGSPVVVQTDGPKVWEMTHVKDALYVAFIDVPNFSELNYAYRYGERLTGKDRVRVENFRYGPDSIEQPNVPKGTVTKYEWKSQIFPGTVRDYYVYVPAQYDPNGPAACTMVFQDGAGYLRHPFRVPIVFDNLIHKKELPVTIGVFINPGVIPEQGRAPTSNRSFEYDSLSDQYARFPRDEILPEVAKKYHLRADPESRAICGISSGGISAWTLAWQMPEMFGKVLSHVGSFTNIRGSHVYPALIRKTPNKLIRVFLQDGSDDLDNEHGNWPLANQEMAKALKFKGTITASSSVKDSTAANTAGPFFQKA